jgi:hypothetical protein
MLERRYGDELPMDLQDRAVQLAEKPIAVQTIADAIGVPRQTLLTWLERGEAFGEDSDDWRARFYLRFARARARVQTSLIEGLEVKGEKDWKSNAWLLERLFPSAYGKQDKVVVAAVGFSWDQIGRMDVKEVESAAKERGIVIEGEVVVEEDG